MKNDIFTVVLSIILIVTLTVGGYFIKRWWNMFWYYGDATKEIVCEMVKPEYLKNKEDCE
jgi:hypothetical protein